MLCKYGCGHTAQFTLKNKAPCCSASSNSCPENRRINSERLKEKHASGTKGYTYNPNSAWSKGLTAFDDNRVVASYSTDLFTYGKRGPHKKLLIKERGHQCELCKNTEWLGKPITLELEHSDGDSQNNEKSNLVLLCPNCHSQTPTWRRAKQKSGRDGNRVHSDEELVNAISNSPNLNQCLTMLGLKWGSYRTIENFRTMHDLKFGSKL